MKPPTRPKTYPQSEIVLVQLEIALAALGWGTRDLAREPMVSIDTIARFERGEAIKPRTLQAMQRALEAAGVKLIPENGVGAGVRLTDPAG